LDLPTFSPVLSRLLNPQLALWLLIAVVGVAANGLTLLLLRRRMRSPIARNPAIKHMLQHNTFAEGVRTFAQLVALAIGVGYIFGFLQGDAIGWALVVMNGSKVANSVNEFLTALRMDD
jgi:hypothetical protein